jgi:RNA methyltransferase, TrmH family
MLSKSEIKDIQSLSHKKFRDELNLFIAEGPKIVGELMNLLPGQIKKIYGTPDWFKAHDMKANCCEITDEELKRISQLHTPHQVVAIISKFESKEPSGNSFSLYLDTIQDPGNFGTIIRTADWFGIKNIVCSEGCADLYNPKVVQATMASIARVNVFYEEKNNWLKKQSSPVYAAVLNGRPLPEIEKTGKGVLIIGNESRGISDEVLQYAKNKLTIPKKGKAESLNAAVAAGIILAHLVE